MRVFPPDPPLLATRESGGHCCIDGSHRFGEGVWKTQPESLLAWVAEVTDLQDELGFYVAD